METFTISYIFQQENSSPETFNLVFNTNTCEIVSPKRQKKPEWTQLSFFKCPHCPLSEKEYYHCPLAAEIAIIVTHFKHIISYEQVLITVTMNERTITKQTTAQRGVRSVMGLIMACSGCPNTAFFKPMARFHLPFATGEETIYRVTSMFLLSQYFLKINGYKADFELKGLKKIYKDIEMVNIWIAKRLRKTAKSDSLINALILLDIFAKTLPDAIEDSFNELHYLFDTYLASASKDKDSQTS